MDKINVIEGQVAKLIFDAQERLMSLDIPVEEYVEARVELRTLLNIMRIIKDTNLINL